MSSVIGYTQLIGHKDAVLTLQAGRPDEQNCNLLLSGSEDGTARVWDLRTGRTTRCLKAFQGSPVTAIAFGRGRVSSHVIVGANGKLYDFDLRQAAIVATKADAVCPVSKEDINEIAVNATGTSIAACEDSGEVHIISHPPTFAPTTVLRGHSNICSAVSFRNDTQLISGGMDNYVMLWDLARVAAGRPTLPLRRLGTNPAAPTTGQMFNPPFVHSLRLDSTGQRGFAALGNGEVVIYDCKELKELRRLSGHHAPVAAVDVFPSTSTHRVVSAGNDQHIVVWNLDSILEANAQSTKEKKKRKKKKKKGVTATAPEGKETKDEHDDETTEISSNDAPSSSSSTSTWAIPSTGHTSSSASSVSEQKRPLNFTPAVHLPFSESDRQTLDTSLMQLRVLHSDKPNALAVSAFGVIHVADGSGEITCYHLKE